VPTSSQSLLPGTVKPGKAIFTFHFERCQAELRDKDAEPVITRAPRTVESDLKPAIYIKTKNQTIPTSTSRPQPLSE